MEGVRRVQAVKVQSTDKRGVSNLPKQVHHAWNNTLEYVYNTHFLRRDKKRTTYTWLIQSKHRSTRFGRSIRWSGTYNIHARR